MPSFQPISRKWLLPLLLIVVAGNCTPAHAVPLQSYRPVILMHGLMSNPSSLAQLEGFIKDAHPGTEVLNVDAYNTLASVTEMWTQVKGIHSKIKGFLDRATDGVNMVCSSQGGMVCRGILEHFSVPVKTFISLASPQAGQFGVGVRRSSLIDSRKWGWIVYASVNSPHAAGELKFFFPNCTRNTAYLVAYTKLGQKLSLANYWNDPYHQARYKKYSKFLPLLNEEASSTYRSNFLNLEQLVLIGGPDDGIIGPWQSSHFGFYDADERIVPMTSQNFYRDDSFGLRTLDEQGKVKVLDIPGVTHGEWSRRKDVFDKYIEPWLN